MKKSQALKRTGVGKWPALFFAVVLAFFGVVFVAPASNAASSDLEKSIVQVAIIWTGTVKYIDTDPADGKQYWYTSNTTTSVGISCTGWFASSEGDIVTAGHCVDPAMDRQSSFVQQFLADHNAKFSQAQLQDAIDTWQVLDIQRAIYVTQNDVPGAVIDKWMVAKFVDYSPWVDGDVALLNATGVSNTPAIAVAPATPDQGIVITSIGFPGNVSNVQNQLTLRASFMDGTVSSHQSKKNGVPVTGVSAPISEGMSGGPTVNAQNQVVGVNSYRLTQDAPNFNFITDTVELNKFLKKNDVAFVTQTVPEVGVPSAGSTVKGVPGIPGGSEPVTSSAGGGVSAGVIVVILILVLGGGGGLIAYIRRNNKTKTSQPQPQAQAWGQPQQQGQPPQFNNGQWGQPNNPQQPTVNEGWASPIPAQPQQQPPQGGHWGAPVPPPQPAQPPAGAVEHSPAQEAAPVVEPRPEVQVCTHQGETGMFCSQCGGKSTAAG